METKEFKDLLISSVNELKQKPKSAFVDGQIAVIELLLISIAKGESDMKTIQNALVAQVVRLEDINPRRRSSELEASIIEITEALKSGEAALMSDKITYGHLSTKVSNMKRDKKLPLNVFVVKRGEQCYLSKN